MSSNPNIGSTDINRIVTFKNPKEKLERPTYVILKKDTNVSYYAKNFGMSNEEFMKWVNVKSTLLKKGTRIDFPAATVPKGKGIYALAKKYGMTMDEFAKLNRIPKPYNEYKAGLNEQFYVKPNKNNIKNEKPELSEEDAKTQIEEAEKEYPEITAGVKIGAHLGTLLENQQKYGSTFSPEEIAEKLEYEANDKWGAVGKKEFDDMFNEINPKNVIEVLEAYKKNNDGRTLVNRITSEIRSSQDSRKLAVMKLFDAVVQRTGSSEVSRLEFEKELNEQFNSFGMVNTENLDKMINKMIPSSPDVDAITATTSIATSGQIATTPPKGDGTKVILPKDGTFTSASLQKDAIESAKKKATKVFEQYCKDNNIEFSEDKLDLSPMNRIPAPVIKNNRIVASESPLLAPTTTPNGKVVVVNPGHGGFSSKSGYFDTGSYSFIKKGSGKYAPLIEYEKMKMYSEGLVEKLRAQGYAVVVTGGHVETISEEKPVSRIINELNDGTKGGKKYDKKDIMFISLHADSQPGSKGSGVCYDSRFQDDTELAVTLQKSLNEDDWIQTGLSERNWNVPKKGLQVLHQTEQNPSVLVEVEFVNGAQSQNLDSKNYQTRFENKLVQGINEYFGIEK